ncbi:hypothetical protein ABPG75_011297 [Micractinium tetrahymenae]
MPAGLSRSGGAALALLAAWALYILAARRSKGGQAPQGSPGLLPKLLQRWLAQLRNVPRPATCGGGSLAPASPTSASATAGQEDDLPTPRRTEPLLLYACCGSAAAAKPAEKAAGHSAPAGGGGSGAAGAAATAAELKALHAYALLACTSS